MKRTHSMLRKDIPWCSSVCDQLLIWEVASEQQYNHVMSKPGHLQQIPKTLPWEQTMEEKNIGCWTKRHSLSIMALN